jgi:phage terminase large subunit GpA-like protein
MSISTWAERNITISSGNNRGMHYDTSFMPYQNEIMDCVHDPEITDITMCCASRVGKTFIVQNIMAYFMVHQPEAILYVRPTDSDINKFSKEELESLIQNTPGLKDVIDANSSTYDYKKYPGGSLRLTGSNSAGNLAGFGAKICCLDEINKFSAVPGFGNPLDLARERTSEYALYGRKVIAISTPTIQDAENTVEWLYEKKSDRRIYLCPCPHCGHEQQLLFKQVKFQHCLEALDSIYYECEKCHGHWTDSQRLAAMRAGHWHITRPEIRGHAGFQISRLYSPLATMESIVRDFLNKKDNYLSLKQFVNEALGESWDTSREIKASGMELYQRREHYLAEVPRGVGILTMAVDVQGNSETENRWLEYEVKGWGRNNESWTIEHGEILGSPTENLVWDELSRVRNKLYTTWAGTTLPIIVCGIDCQGGFTTEVKQFLKGKRPYYIGLEGKKNKPGAPLVTRRKNKNMTGWEVGTDCAKDSILSFLSVQAPGANYCHFPDTVSEKYFLSLLAEKKITKFIGGVKTEKYVNSSGARNEVLDLFVYNWFLYNWLQRYKSNLLEDSLLALEAIGGAEQPTASATVSPEAPQVAAQPVLVPRLPVPAAPAPAEDEYIRKTAGFFNSGNRKSSYF